MFTFVLRPYCLSLGLSTVTPSVALVTVCGWAPTPHNFTRLACVDPLFFYLTTCFSFSLVTVSMILVLKTLPATFCSHNFNSNAVNYGCQPTAVKQNSVGLVENTSLMMSCGIGTLDWKFGKDFPAGKLKSQIST